MQCFIWKFRINKNLLFIIIFVWSCIFIFHLLISTNSYSESTEQQQRTQGIPHHFYFETTEPLVFGSDLETLDLDKNVNNVYNDISNDNLNNLKSNENVEIKKLILSEPHIDINKYPQEDEILSNLTKFNLPLNNWKKLRKIQKYAYSHSQMLDKNCEIVYPSPYELEFNNIYWQQFRTDSSMFYLYNAYYDDRWRGGSVAKVRILAMIDKIKPPESICQLWYDNLPAPLLSSASYTYGWHRKWGNYRDGLLQPFIITCDIPQFKNISENIAPTSVSLATKPCSNATNNLRVVNKRLDKIKDFAVCVKGLDYLYEDLSVRLIEWIELLNILGADKIFFYNLETHPNITKVLNYYQSVDMVDVTPITLPGAQPNILGFRHLYLKKMLATKRQNELMPYNDCLYRNLYSYKYLALLDIDEIIMPKVSDNWSQLMQIVEKLALLKNKNQSYASYNVRNVYFFDDSTGDKNQNQLNHVQHESDIPNYLHMLQHIYRSSNYTKPGQYVKSFHNIEHIVSMHNHFPLNCFGRCTSYPIDTSLAQLQHYRKDCVGNLKKTCNSIYKLHSIRDETIFKYKNKLIIKANEVLKKLAFF
jgi:hypothetical protein